MRDNIKTDITKIAIIALMVALEIVCTRLLTVTTPFIRISFGFLPIAIVAIKYGPLQAGAAYIMADLIGFMLFPSGFAFFPGFAITAFLTGCVYGIFMYKRRYCSVCLIRIIAGI